MDKTSDNNSFYKNDLGLQCKTVGQVTSSHIPGFSGALLTKFNNKSTDLDSVSRQGHNVNITNQSSNMVGRKGANILVFEQAYQKKRVQTATLNSSLNRAKNNRRSKNKYAQ